MLETWNKVRSDILALKLYCLGDREKESRHKNMTDTNEILLKSDKYSSWIKTIKLIISKDNYQIIQFSYEFQKTSATLGDGKCATSTDEEQLLLYTEDNV